MAHETEPRLYFVVKAGTAPEAVAERLAAVEVAALLIAPAADKPLDAATAKPLVDLAQGRGIAALIEGDAQLARTLRADGVHVPWSKDIVAQYEEARDIIGGRFIVGVDAGRSRHDAMTLGEAGADYIGFGIPPHVDDRETARARRLDLIEWWSEIFEVPCVAFDVDNGDDATALARTGADFVALKIGADTSTQELQQWAASIDAAVAAREAAA